jgi:predicted TIM-barrel fold metal-dependent hydrolase
MALDVSKYIFIDNHAHSLLTDYSNLDEFGLRQCFTESRSRTIIDQHVQHSVHYMDMIRNLGMIVGAKGEAGIIEKRIEMQHPAYLRKLWDSVSIGGLIVDDGFASDKMIGLQGFGEACQRPVYRCRRIESVLEQCLPHAETFDELEGAFLQALFDTTGGEVVALKSIIAYRGGLAVNTDVRVFQAEFDFTDAKAEFEGGKTRIEQRPLYDYLLIQALEAAGDYDIPVQFHVGLGDDDALISQSNPALMQPLMKLPWMQKTKFVLLHCYPYVREAAMLCSLYANVYMDLSLSVSLVSSGAASMILEALAMAPTTKILAGTDGHSCPETHWYGALRWKMGLQSALNQLIMDGMMNSTEAGEIAARILHGNAKELYKLQGLA